MQVFSVQIWFLSALVISSAHLGQKHEEATAKSIELEDARVASIGSGDHSYVDKTSNLHTTINIANNLRDQNTNNFPPDSKWPVPQNAVEFGLYLSQAANNITKPSANVPPSLAFPPANDPQILQAPIAYKPDRPNLIQQLVSNVQGNHSTNTFFIVPSSTTTTEATTSTGMNDPLLNPVPGIITASQSTANNATNTIQGITNLLSTNVQNGFFGSGNTQGNRPSNDEPASGSSNPLQGIIDGSQAAWNNGTGAAQNLAGQFGANVQNGLSNIFGINLNRPSNDEPATQSTEGASTTEAGTTASNEPTTTVTSGATTGSTETTVSASSTTAAPVTFLPLVSFVNNSQSLVNSSVLIQTVTSQLTSNLPTGLANIFLPRPTKTRETNTQEFPELVDDETQADTVLQDVPPPTPPSCPSCSSMCTYRPFQESRIVEGIDVESRNKYPWIVFLTYLDSPSGQGSLINDRAIVTTATIIESMPVKMHIRALLGVYNRANPNETVSTHHISTTYIHPGFKNTNQYANNIGLLILENALSSFQAICLPAPVPDSPPVAKATIIGWGAEYLGGPLANVLQQVELQMYASIICSMTAPQTTSKNLCGGTPQFTSNAGATCTGDGGDPLVAKKGTEWELIGVALDIPGLECGKNRAPAIFTAIIPYLEWIETYGAGCECYVG